MSLDPAIRRGHLGLPITGYWLPLVLLLGFVSSFDPARRAPEGIV